jgi:hypothetical protein
VGIADGAKGNWHILGRHTEVQVVDFWHAVGYLGKAAAVLYRGQPQARKAWMDDACHRLKHEPGGARCFPRAVELMITADGGGSNSSRNRR